MFVASLLLTRTQLAYRCYAENWKRVLTSACVLPLQIVTETAEHDGEPGDNSKREEGA